MLSTAALLTSHIQTPALHTHTGAASAFVSDVLKLQNSPPCISTKPTQMHQSVQKELGTELACTKGLRSKQPDFRTGKDRSELHKRPCLWDQLLLLCCLPVQSSFCSAAANAAQALLLPRHSAFLAWLHRSNNFLCLQRALLLENVSGFVLIKTEGSFATVFQATHCL